MKMMLDFAKAGLKPCGKLLGKNKAGVELYEQLFENQRVLTSFKDGKLYKRCVRSNNDNVIKLNTENFNTGDVVEITRHTDKDGHAYLVTKKSGKTGNTEEMYFCRPHIKKEWDTLNNVEFRYKHDDVKNNKVFSIECDSGELRVNTYQEDLSGKITDYFLPNGCIVPKDTELRIDPVLAKKPVLEYYAANGEMVTLENSTGLAKFFVDFAKKMCGFKA